MEKLKHTILNILAALLAAVLLATGVSALTDGEVEAQVAALGKETVTGNVLIWFLCAIAFLKVSQKVDSFMQSLGINVGHTGGSMLGDLMVGLKGVKALSGGGASGGGGTSSGGSSGAGTAFLAGGLAGAVGRSVEKDAAAGVTGRESGTAAGKFISNAAYRSSVSKGGDFANNIIGSVAKGDVRSDGTITGEKAAEAMISYFGHTGQAGAPSYSGVEIGGGRITGKESTPESPDMTAFAMYSAERYTEPEGSFTTETAADGSKWYKQTPQDTVEKTPYYDADGEIRYRETIVQKLPQIPKRKDRL